MIAWLAAFVATCAIELVVVHARLRDRSALGVALAAQLATHPLVWLAMAFMPGPQLVKLCAIELWATLFEAMIYARFLRLQPLDAFALSALANAASLLGVALFGTLLS